MSRSMSTNLNVLSNTAGFEQMLKEFQEQIQQQVQELRHEVAALKEDHMPPEESLDLEDTSRSRISSLPLDPIPHDMDPSLQHIQGASWAEEMEILQPQGDEDLYRSAKLKRPSKGNASDGGSTEGKLRISRQ